MQQDSRKPGNPTGNKTTRPHSPVQSYQCSHCVLIFKSKIVLWEHLGKTHGLDVDALLKGATSTRMGADTASDVNPNSPRDNPGDSSVPALQAQGKDSSVVAAGKSNEAKPNSVKAMLPLQNEPAVEVKAISSQTKIKLVTNLSTGMKMYKKTSGKITQYFKASSVSDVTSPPLNPPHQVRPTNMAKKTIVLRKPDATSKKDSVFKGTATSQNNLPANSRESFLMDEELSRPLFVKYDRVTDPEVPFSAAHRKRLPDECSVSPAKKHKGNQKEAESPKSKAISSNHNNGSQLILEFSDEEREEERKVSAEGTEDLLNGEGSDSSKTFCCNCCSFSTADIPRLHAHYQGVHPYIRYTSDIKDPGDWKVMFRCLECPVEFCAADTLQDHYKNEHPDAPDVFDKPPHKLLFKCFVCTFTTSTLEVLKKHYRKEHPPYKVSNSLMYCKYSANSGRRKPPQLSAKMNAASKKETETLSIHQSPASKGPNADVYKCNSCTFCHKSVVAMQVHYQKHHPGLGMTIDQIRQVASVVPDGKSPVSPEKTSKSVKTDTPIDKSRSPLEESVLNSTKKSKNISTLTTPPNLSQTTGSSSGKGGPEVSLQKLNVLSTEVKSPNSSSNSSGAINDKLSTSAQKASVSSPRKDQFFCQYCNYCNPTLNGVLSHQIIKHARRRASKEGIIRHAEERRRDSSANSHSDNCEQSAAEETVQDKKEKAAKDPVPIDPPENHFFCEICNFAGNSITGVLRHQSRRHPKDKMKAVDIFKYTVQIRAEMRKSQSGLPLPRLDALSEQTLFCQLCNFSHTALPSVLSHQKKTHPKLVAKDPAQLIEAYSSLAHKQTRKVQLKTENQPASPTPTPESPIETVEALPPENPVPPPATQIDSKIPAFKCHKCAYATSQVYLFRRHLRTKHKIIKTAAEVLKKAFDKGDLQAGYHCPYCVFMHRKAARLHLHCKQNHPGNQISLAHIIDQMHAGPVVAALKKKKKKKKERSELEADSTVNADDRPTASPSQGSGKDQAGKYPCQACSFSGGSLQRLMSHYLTVHPWSVKEDGSVLDVVGSRCLSESRHSKESDGRGDASETFDSYQEPLELEPTPQQATVSLQLFRCHFCSINFNTLHGLKIHYGIRHFGKFLGKSLDRDAAVTSKGDATTPVLLYTCPRCRYVNTKEHGMLTHCQMMHSTLKVSVGKLHRSEAQVRTKDKRLQHKDALGEVKFGGYMCKICPVIRGSLSKLKVHDQQEHNGLRKLPAAKPPDAIKKQLLSKYHITQGSLSQSAFKNSSAKYNNREFKCSLCGYFTLEKRYLARHYKRRHGWEAFNAHYALVHKVRGQAKPATPGGPASPPPEKPPGAPLSGTAAEDSQERDYKCRLCSYSSETRRYIVSHYKKRHGVAALLQHFDAPCGSRQSSLHQHKVKGPSKLTEGEPEKRQPGLCKICNLPLSSPELLSVHYTGVHRAEFKLDFTGSLGSAQKGLKAGFKCGHCSVKLKSVVELCCHLDYHREVSKKKAVAEKLKACGAVRRSPEAAPVKPHSEAKPPERQLVRDSARWNGEAEESPEEEEGEDEDDDNDEVEPEPPETAGFTCKQCGRAFTSLMGLRVHERGHALVTVLLQREMGSTPPSKDNLSDFISYRPGTQKAFRCSLCSYRSNFLGLLRCHLIKKHRAAVNAGSPGAADRDDGSSASAEKGPPTPPDLQENSCSSVPDEADVIQNTAYLEPADVQRQLSHYSSMARADAPATAPAPAPPPLPPRAAWPPDDKLLTCELCDFTSEHISSVRRHYTNRHGRKLLRCKDCNFFSGARKTMMLHEESGHSNFQSQPTHAKNLRCPLCLYMTKNKNNMIDHIVLHREERVVPIEVRRPKLSRYLQGLVFRCHKCTFSSASAENLRRHTVKHDGIKPYKCRLCYFDCGGLSELEAHLCDKHQVVRNHELVGQVNLDQMEAGVSRRPKEDEDDDDDGSSNTGEGNNEDEDMETDLGSAVREIKLDNEAEPTCEESSGEGERCEMPVRIKEEPCEESLDGVARVADVGVQHQELVEDSQRLFFSPNDPGEKAETGKLGGEGGDPGDESERGPQDMEVPACRSETIEAQPASSESDRASLGTDFENASGLSAQNHEGRMEDDILREILELDGDSRDRHKVNTVPSGDPKRRNSELAKSNWCKESEGSGGDLPASCEEGRADVRKNNDKPRDGYREMPVLENEFLNGKGQSQAWRTEVDLNRPLEDGAEHQQGNQKGNLEGESSDARAGAAEGGEEAGKTPPSEGASTSTDDRALACALCGRSFTDGLQLERHIKRHGL